MNAEKVVSLSLTPTLSEGEGDEKRVRVFPNPATNTINLTTPTDLVGTTAVMTDLIGRIANTIALTNNQQAIEVSQLAAGVYFLTIQNRSDIAPIKVVILKP